MAIAYSRSSDEHVDWLRPSTFLFVVLHVAPLVALSVGARPIDWIIIFFSKETDTCTCCITRKHWF